MLPKINVIFSNGGIYSQMVKCGKKNCRCAMGYGHLSYYYFRRLEGKMKKTYIRKADLETLWQEVEFVVTLRQRIKLKKKINKERWKILREKKIQMKKDGIEEDIFTTGKLYKTVKKLCTNEYFLHRVCIDANIPLMDIKKLKKIFESYIEY